MAFITTTPIFSHSSFLSKLTRPVTTTTTTTIKSLSSTQRPLQIPRHVTASMSISTSSSSSVSITPLPPNPVIGFIGLGVMGEPMARNLSSIFSDIVLWNRTPKSFSPSSSSSSSCNVTTAQTAYQVIQSADITFSMLSTPEATESVYSTALDAIKPGKVLVDCSTLRAQDMQNTAKRVHQLGGSFLEAPVSGSKVPAEQGQLIFLCAGDQHVFDDRITQKAFQVMGKRSFFLGTDVGNGTKMKLVVNQLMATMLAALAESIVLTEAVGLSVPDLLEVLSLGAMNNPMFALKGPKMKHGEKGYETNFPLEHAQKDVRFAQALGDDLGIPMSVSSAANEWYKAAKGLGLSRDDFSAVIESVRASAGRQ